jgi:uncharacterized damage-inducible protein DinB
MPTTTRPDATEFAPYYGRYIEKVPEGEVARTLRAQLGETLALLRAVPEERADDRYAPDKWSIKEVVGHMSDTERIMSYRMLRIARGDETPLPGFEQNDYVRNAHLGRRTLASLVAELEAVRGATLALVDGLDDEELARRGTASTFPVTARALAWIIAGHERHHLGLLREQYGLK